MRLLYKSLASFAGTIVYGPYSPSPLRKGAWFVQALCKEIAGAVHARRYATLLLWSSAVFFAFAFFAFLFSLPPRSDAAWAGVPPAPTAAIASPSVRTQELHIANNGAILLRSAQVMAIQGTTLSLYMSWGSAQFNWTAHTNASTYETHDFGTRFLNQSGQKISLDDLKIGDFVTVTGKLDSAAPQPTLEADNVRLLQ